MPAASSPGWRITSTEASRPCGSDPTGGVAGAARSRGPPGSRWDVRMAIKACVTISLVEEARGGPFVFWDDLGAGCRKAAALGYDAVEVFPRAPDAVDPADLRRLLDDHGLELAAVGTGAGWVVRRLTLTHRDADR